MKRRGFLRGLGIAVGALAAGRQVGKSGLLTPTPDEPKTYTSRYEEPFFWPPTRSLTKQVRITPEECAAQGLEPNLPNGGRQYTVRTGLPVPEWRKLKEGIT
jgi:hypothetical protein